ncbi:unnamed protein product [Ceratitis capitata]|uniref:(Mediterranean fruit fly) hypothetical protein n=1 Tax=Ceratitis capitata TaxID=7213 RepID=A0A811USM7_CERCA|nr:unnamed protein product [Ceratitis capitata]
MQEIYIFQPATRRAPRQALRLLVRWHGTTWLGSSGITGSCARHAGEVRLANRGSAATWQRANKIVFVFLFLIFFGISTFSRNLFSADSLRSLNSSAAIFVDFSVCYLPSAAFYNIHRCFFFFFWFCS